MEDIINLECKYYLKNVKEDLNNIKLVDINTLKPYKISKNEEIARHESVYIQKNLIIF